VGRIQGEGRVDPTPVGRKTVINMTPSFFTNNLVNGYSVRTAKHPDFVNDTKLLTTIDFVER